MNFAAPLRGLGFIFRINHSASLLYLNIELAQAYFTEGEETTAQVLI